MLDTCCEHSQNPRNINLGIPCSCNPPTWIIEDEEEDDLDLE